MATLTSVYADSTIVLGPLATEAQPEAYDLCEKHVSSFTAPRGWQIIRLATEFEPAPPSEDDLLALADAVREASRAPATGCLTGRAPSSARRDHAGLPDRPAAAPRRRSLRTRSYGAATCGSCADRRMTYEP